MNEPIISIIVPCYNVEWCIDRCVNSIVNQTIGFEKLQLILVNDASTDGTLDKLTEWEQKYPDNILIITYDVNKRQGGARNEGLKYAEGDYVGFVDSDDWIEAEMYETLYKLAVEKNCDVTKCKLVKDLGKGDNITGKFTNKKVMVQNYQKKGAFFEYSPCDAGKNGLSGAIVTAIIKRSVVEKAQVLFPEDIGYEDNFWCGILWLYVGSECLIDYPFYHYYINPASTTMKQNDVRQLDKLKIEIMLLEEYKRRGAFELFYDRLLKDMVQRFYLNFLFIMYMRFDYLPINIENLKRTIEAYFPNYRSIIDRGDYQVLDRPLIDALLSDQILSDEDQQALKDGYLSTLYKAVEKINAIN